jgi:HK97 family phage major capsid protein
MASSRELAFRNGYIMPANVKAELMAATGASSGVTADGGVFVRNEWNTSLMNAAQTESQLLRRCDSIPVGDGFDGVELPYINETSRATGSRWGGVQVYRAAEAAAVTATKPTFGKFELRLEEAKGLFYATDRVLRDAAVLEAVVGKAFPSEFAFKIDDEIMRGTGTGQCLGILNADCTVSQAKETAQTADTVKAENVIKMHSRLLARNMARAEWFINQECLPQLQTMAVAVGTAGGQLVYMPPGGLTSAPYGTLLGRPVNVVEVASGLGDVGDIFLADFSEYLIIQKAMSSASSMHVRFIYDEMTFR